MGRPVAYLRRSNASRPKDGNGGRGVSFEMQKTAVTDLAARHGDILDDADLLVDWGISGRHERTAARKAYADLRERIAGGSVSALYAYSLSRLARSTRELLDLSEACASARVPVRLAKEGDLNFTTPHGRLYLTVLAAVATFESDVAGERGRDRNARLRAEGRFVGRPPFGWRHGPDGALVRYEPEAALDDLVRSIYAAEPNARKVARTLNEEGVPSPTGGQWRDGTVRRMLARDGGVTTPPRGSRTVRGSRAVRVAPFARLLECAECGHRLTTSRKAYTTASGEVRRWTGYACQGARLVEHHSRPAAISEAAVLAWARPEVARLRVPYDAARFTDDVSTERTAIEERRARVVDMVEAGTITRQEAEPRLERIAHELAEIDKHDAVVALPPAVDWSWPADTLGNVLAAIFERVTVDLPAGRLTADWRVPEWRGAAPQATIAR